MKRPARLIALCSLGLPLSAISHVALAQTPAVRPDAGTSLDSVRQPAAPVRPALGVEVQQESRPALNADSSFRTRVQAFRITGTTVFADNVLQPLLAASTGRELSLADLNAAAAAITRYYREKGYFAARAYVPQQEIVGGVVEIAVLEGRYGDVGVEGPGIRLSKNAAQRYLSAKSVMINRGGLVYEPDLERALLLMNDFPSVDVRSTLRPGSTLGTANLTVTATEGNLVTGAVDADNYGNKYTGRYRLGGTVFLNSPTGYGDLLSLRANTAKGLDYLRAAYQIPIMYSGVKAGVSASGLRYKLGDVFAAGNFSGKSTAVAGFVSYPFMRTRAMSVYGTVTADRKHLVNNGGGANLSDKTVNALSMALTMDAADSLGGRNELELTFYGGKLNLDGNAADRLADRTTAQAHGSFSKVAYRYSRLQSYGGSRFSWLVGLQGQQAGKNLDSSEKTSLGGHNGVRGYAQGEATGDSATILTGEARWLAVAPGAGPLGGAVQLSGFVDYGWVRLHETTWAGWQGGNANLANNYRLSSAGVGLTWAKPGSYSLKASVARAFGSNRGVDINGRDSENGTSKTRAWLQGVVWF